ncbi:hypothetical protein ACFL0M_13075 [Thermodesulfobacteriota bacterium]
MPEFSEYPLSYPLVFILTSHMAIATPYVQERNEALIKYLERSGFEVPAIKGLGITRNLDLTKVPFHASYQLAVEAFRESKGVEGIYIPCGRWPVVDNIDPLERDLGVPVVSNNLSKVWFGLKSLGIREPIRGYGTLLERLTG